MVFLWFWDAPPLHLAVSVLVPAVLLLLAVRGGRARDDRSETQGGEEHRQEPRGLAPHLKEKKRKTLVLPSGKQT